MAHPCIHCGSECYCNGHIDDCIVSRTPANCEGCGCSKDDDRWDDDEDYGPWPDDDDHFEPCRFCDQSDACADFGCAMQQGIMPEITEENISEFI